MIDFETFKKLDFRIARIMKAEKVSGTRNLLKLQIDLGKLGQRQIVTGIAQYYTKEELEGKLIVVLANLKPAVFRGEKSEGMLLAGEIGKSGDPDYRVVLVVPEQEMSPGAPVH